MNASQNVLTDIIICNPIALKNLYEDGVICACFLWQFEGPTSSSCWDKLDRKIRKLHGHDALKAFGEDNKIVRSGPAMFGFSHHKIKELIRVSQDLVIYNILVI